jgi:hypothetical protein
MVLERSDVAHKTYGSTKQPAFRRPQPRQAPVANEDDLDVIDLIDAAHVLRPERRAPWEVTAREMMDAVVQAEKEFDAGLGTTHNEFLKEQEAW